MARELLSLGLFQNFFVASMRGNATFYSRQCSPPVQDPGGWSVVIWSKVERLIGLLLVESGGKRLYLFGALKAFDLRAAVKRALVTLLLASAQVRLADLGAHDLAGGGDLETLGSRFVGL